MAYPTKYEEDVAEKIVALLRGGNYVETAAAACGLSKQTVYNWLRRGARGEEPYADFVARFWEAQAQAEARLVSQIDTHASKDWRAAAWKLERKFPDRWGEHVKHDVDTRTAEERREEADRVRRAVFAAAGISSTAFEVVHAESDDDLE